MNKIGSLYQVKKHYWYLFPNKETAAAPSPGATTRFAAHAAGAARYWSRQLNCTVSYVSPNDFVVLLEVDGKHKKFLSTNGDIGWTWFDESYNDCFEEVTQL